MRFGSCLAIGISCAGTGSREAMDVLEPMMEDVVDFVRQVNQVDVPSSQVFVCRVRSVVGTNNHEEVVAFNPPIANSALALGGSW